MPCTPRPGDRALCHCPSLRRPGLTHSTRLHRPAREAASREEARGVDYLVVLVPHSLQDLERHGHRALLQRAGQLVCVACASLLSLDDYTYAQTRPN